MLTVEDVSHVLGIGLAHAYEVAHRRDFPTITSLPLKRTRRSAPMPPAATPW